jgi:hypothetical protein
MALSDFRQLLEYYDGELISAATFMYRWFELRKQERSWMGPAEDPLSQVFVALDDFVPDTGQERTEGAIDERQLREVVHRSLAQISRIDDSETRRFDISRDVVSGLADADPEIRSYSAVIAREFPAIRW